MHPDSTRPDALENVGADRSARAENGFGSRLSAMSQGHGATPERVTRIIAADSSGSRCYNCHMPHTTFGLLHAMRSHQVSSPNVRESIDHGRPNACNLCHLDQTLSWTAKKLHEWYQQPVPELSEDDNTIAAAVQWLVKGDAGQRALLAWGMGWESGAKNFRTRLAVSLFDLHPDRSLCRGAFRCLEIASNAARVL